MKFVVFEKGAELEARTMVLKMRQEARENQDPNVRASDVCMVEASNAHMISKSQRSNIVRVAAPKSAPSEDKPAAPKLSAKPSQKPAAGAAAE